MWTHKVLQTKASYNRFSSLISEQNSYHWPWERTYRNWVRSRPWRLLEINHRLCLTLFCDECEVETKTWLRSPSWHWHCILWVVFRKEELSQSFLRGHYRSQLPCRATVKIFHTYMSLNVLFQGLSRHKWSICAHIAFIFKFSLHSGLFSIFTNHLNSVSIELRFSNESSLCTGNFLTLHWSHFIHIIDQWRMDQALPLPHWSLLRAGIIVFPVLNNLFNLLWPAKNLTIDSKSNLQYKRSQQDVKDDNMLVAEKQVFVRPHILVDL